MYTTGSLRAGIVLRPPVKLWKIISWETDNFVLSRHIAWTDENEVYDIFTAANPPQMSMKTLYDRTLP